MPQTAVPILDIFANVTDPRHPSKVQHPLPDLLTVAVCGPTPLKRSNSGPRRSSPGSASTSFCPMGSRRMTPSPGSSA